VATLFSAGEIMSATDILPAPIVDAQQTWNQKWETERRAFRRMLPDLLKSHQGLYVAVHGEQVVESGDDLVEVALRAYQRFGYLPIYVERATSEPPPPVRIPSPRLRFPEV